MWRTVTSSGHVIRPAAIALCLFGMCGAWQDIPSRWQFPTAAAAVVLCAVPLSYWLVDLLALTVPIWRRQEAEAQEVEAGPEAPDAGALAIAKSEMSTFLQVNVAHNRTLPQENQDGRRIWPATVLAEHYPQGLGAETWTRHVNTLQALGLIDRRRVGVGTWADRDLSLLWWRVDQGQIVIPPPPPKGREGV